MMLITRKKPAKRKKKMVKKHTTSIPSPETPIPPKIEKTEEEPIDLMPEAVIKQSPPESTPISPPMPESEHSVYPKKEQQEEPEKENTFYFEKAPTLSDSSLSYVCNGGFIKQPYKDRI